MQIIKLMPCWLTAFAGEYTVDEALNDMVEAAKKKGRTVSVNTFLF